MMAAAMTFIPPLEAVHRLREAEAKYWMADAGEAIDRLRWLLGQTDILQLYQAYFPGKYRKSKASLRSEAPGGHSPREQEFFHLVAARLFPIADLCLEEDERLDCIPVETAALDPEGIEDWPTTWQVLFGMINLPEMVDWNAVQAFLPEGAALPLIVTSRENCEVDWNRFFKQATRNPRLKHLPDAFAMAGFETGNHFLDVPPDMLYNSEMPDWNAENIDWLTQEWKTAQPIFKRAQAVVDWLETLPQRLADLIVLWNACVKFKPRKEAQ